MLNNPSNLETEQVAERLRAFQHVLEEARENPYLGPRSLAAVSRFSRALPAAIQQRMSGKDATRTESEADRQYQEQQFWVFWLSHGFIPTTFLVETILTFWDEEVFFPILDSWKVERSFAKARSKERIDAIFELVFDELGLSITDPVRIG